MSSGAVLISPFAVFDIIVHDFTRQSLAFRRKRTCSTQPSCDFGVESPCPAATSLAARSASAASFLPPPRLLFSRLGLRTS